MHTFSQHRINHICKSMYLAWHENKSTMFNVELYQQLLYDVHRPTMTKFAGELEKTNLLDNDCMFSIKEKHFRMHIKYYIYVENIMIYTGIDMLRSILDSHPTLHTTLAVQMEMLVCETQTRVGICFRKDPLNQHGFWQDYTRRLLYIKQLSIQLVL